ncbi:MAG: PrsW family intramembrane metalloprotease [Spirochaetales bacterium]|uniref:PrsW family intramembrane metalloprotease n=1 Tax=Candidatus Thalassospirochaeta sargassi TaxID=3119039 RepID=A0AAJ1MPJ5_9SPIO|nr:PrsW family intramembrane metalloprotease [Spirochaetales bacterium]
MVLVISVTVSFFWLWFIKRFETSTRLTGKPSVIFSLFLCGIGSVFAALFLAELEELLLSHVAFLSPLTYYVFYVGLCEEFGKFLVFYLAASLTDMTKEPKDGLLQAAAVALGFAILENILYSDWGLGILLLRSVMATTGHMSFAVIWGYAAGLYLYSKRAGKNKYSFGMVIGAVCTAAVFHGLYDYFLGMDLKPISFLLDAIVLSISVYILRSLKGRSPYESGDKEAVAEAIESNSNNFHLNRLAGVQALKTRDFETAAKYFKKASTVNHREISTKVCLLFTELLTGSVEEFEAYRTLDRICSSINVSNLNRLRARIAEVFAGCPDEERLLNLIDDLIDETGYRELLKERIAQFDKYANAIAGKGCADSGFLISDKNSLPMAYRHPSFYTKENNE